MKILVVSSLLPASVLPAREPYVWLEARALERLGEIAYVGPIPWVPPLVAGERWAPLRSVPRRDLVEGVAVLHPRYLVVPKAARAIQGWSYARALERALRALASRFRPDAIYATWAYPDLYAAVEVGRRHVIPVIGKVIGSDMNSLPELGLKRKVERALAGADRIVAVCEALRTKAVALGASPERCSVVEHGVDIDRFRVRDRAACRRELGIAADVELVLYVGNVETVKGPDVLVGAFARLAGERTAARLTVIGDGTQLARAKASADALGVGDRVLFLGRKPHDVVARWMSAADLLCVPSRSEGLPNVILESIACGTPVVAFRVGGVGEALVPGVAGALVEPGDERALALAMASVLAERLSPERVRSSTRVRSWQDSARELFAVIEQAVAGAGGQGS